MSDQPEQTRPLRCGACGRFVTVEGFSKHIDEVCPGKWEELEATSMYPDWYPQHFRRNPEKDPQVTAMGPCPKGPSVDGRPLSESPRLQERHMRGQELVDLNLPVWVVRALYDHIGTMPFAPESWSNELRAVLSEVLACASTNRSEK